MKTTRWGIGTAAAGALAAAILAVPSTASAQDDDHDEHDDHDEEEMNGSDEMDGGSIEGSIEVEAEVPADDAEPADDGSEPAQPVEGEPTLTG